MEVSANTMVMRRSFAPQDGSVSLLNEQQAADLLNLKVPTLRRWRWAGKGPTFLKIGGAVRYDPSELEGFIAAARRSSTSELGSRRGPALGLALWLRSVRRRAKAS